jgi:pyruvate/2-oxoglutarate dehydrogenase complex dihydrolipoamide acyltransferase (E2) component
MDVEAQEDGILAKIVVPSGAKGVAVGTRIAVLAEEGDDLATLEMPAEEVKKEAKKEEITPEQSKKQEHTAETKAPQVETSAESTPDTSHNHPTPKRPQHPSPSVMSLLKTHKLDAAAITGTGPKGRLLKGDILAYIGSINKSAPSELSARITKLSKMDLSNIKPATPKPKPAPKEAAKPAAPAPPKESELALPVNFAEVSRIQAKMQATLGVRVPLSTFISKATAAANAALPPVKSAPTQSELFNDILGLPNPPRKTSRGTFNPTISPMPRKGVQAVEVGRSQPDIFDVLIGNAPVGVTAKTKVAGPQEGILAGGENLLSLKVPANEEERARVFLGRVKGLLEKKAGELVL